MCLGEGGWGTLRVCRVGLVTDTSESGGEY